MASGLFLFADLFADLLQLNNLRRIGLEHSSHA